MSNMTDSQLASYVEKFRPEPQEPSLEEEQKHADLQAKVREFKETVRKLALLDDFEIERQVENCEEEIENFLNSAGEII